GGHCIPLDPFYLSWKAKEYDFTTRFIELAGQANDVMPYHVAQRAMEFLNEEGKPLKGSKILLLGMAYKRDVDDLRQSPALKVAKLLIDRGAIVSYHDPHIPKVDQEGLELRSASLTPELLSSQDLAIITTGHTGVDYHLVAEHAPLIFDTRNVTHGISSPKIRRLGVG
ncbi:UDP-N-acetyl-D-glucosamine dehydrogenase, partial [Candidatus Bipolaricaulota bacterium]|nr:UDP-N-acetyl-D-glucosamine dehydrogenase [Candidatus Bipolaricaulota bacterium]